MVYSVFLHELVVLVVFTLTKVSQILVAQILQFCHILQDVRPKTACREVLDDTLSVPFANPDLIVVPVDGNYGFPEFFSRYAPPLCSAALPKFADIAIIGDKQSLSFLATVCIGNNKVVVLAVMD